MLVVANHPFGAIEALWLVRWFGRSGRDYRLLANHWLGALPELRPRLLRMDILRQGTAVRKANARSLRKAAAWLQQGGVLAAFPAGEVAHLHWNHLKVTEGSWSDHIIRLAIRCDATVPPVHFPGHNGAFFQALGLLHSRLRTFFLAREASRPNRQLRVAVAVRLLLPKT